MEINSFTFSKIPNIVFGINKILEIGNIASQYGNTALLVIGNNSLKTYGNFTNIVNSLKKSNIKFYEYKISHEPSPEDIDSAVLKYSNKKIDVVISIGGGSAIDTGKAVSAMLPLNEPVIDYLEDVGTKKHPGNKIPFIAVPTTAGTGSEATKNAVISKIGPNGFKKSLRHNNFMPDVALIDPILSSSCPLDITASCGMDTLSQILESFVSVRSSYLTDLLCTNALEHIRKSLLLLCTVASSNIELRTNMAFAACISGITLTNAGLGTVHGFASSIGGMFNIPHGIICGRLLAPVIKKTIEKLLLSSDSLSSLIKFAQAGEIICGKRGSDAEETCDMLVKEIENYTKVLKIPALSKFGITPSHFNSIAEKTDNKNNPVLFNKKELKQILFEGI